MTGSNICRNTLTCNCNICNPPLSSFVKFVPAPRLVCVELNPGPKSKNKSPIKTIVRDATTDLIKQTINATAMALTKNPKSKSKPKVTSMRATFPTKGSVPTTLRSAVQAPVSIGSIMQNTVPLGNVRVPFASTSINVFVDTTGLLKFGLSGSATQSHRYLQLCPQSFSYDGPDLNVVTDPAFGLAIKDLSYVFKEYKITRLKVGFISIKPTSHAGVVAIACTPDPTTHPPANYDTCTSYQNNVSGSVWSSFQMDLKNMVGKNADLERYYLPAAKNSISYDPNANGRLCSYGQVFGFALGPFDSDENIGVLRIEGEIEFYNLSPFNSNMPNVSLSSSSSSSSSSLPLPQGSPVAVDPIPRHPLLVRQDAYEAKVEQNPINSLGHATNATSASVTPGYLNLTPSPNLSGQSTPGNYIPGVTTR